MTWWNGSTTKAIPTIEREARLLRHCPMRCYARTSNNMNKQTHSIKKASYHIETSCEFYPVTDNVRYARLTEIKNQNPQTIQSDKIYQIASLRLGSKLGIKSRTEAKWLMSTIRYSHFAVNTLLLQVLNIALNTKTTTTNLALNIALRTIRTSNQKGLLRRGWHAWACRWEPRWAQTECTGAGLHPNLFTHFRYD